MKIKIIPLKADQATYFISGNMLISSEEDMLNLMSQARSQTIILHDYNFQKDFFDLSTRKLGEILQKCANYRIRMAIIGDFGLYPSKILPNYIAESNRHKEFIFVSSLEEVTEMWGTE